MTSFFLHLYSCLMCPIDALFPHSYKAKCGHQTELQGTLTKGNGRSTTIKHQFRERYNLPLCFDCILKQGTNCASCRLIIIPGEPVQQRPSNPGNIICAHCLEFGILDCTGKWTEIGYQETPIGELVTIEHYP